MSRTRLPLFFLALLSCGVVLSQRRNAEDVYRKWLTDDVVYIISREERDVFTSLKTDDEKEAFIEQFWKRRDPTPGSEINEFRDEHYRRIAYANDHFHSGVAGWTTDRGRIYIAFGPATEITSQVSGGTYYRSPQEGGGSTATYPFEVWRYRHIPGLGNDVEIEFVDQTFSGDFKIALSPEEKDAFLHIDGAGLTEAEMLGLRDKLDRPYFTGSAYYRDGVIPDPSAGGLSYFERLEQYLKLQVPPSIRFPDLQKIVTAQLYYRDVPFDAEIGVFHLSETQSLLTATVLVSGSQLSYQPEGDLFRAQVDLYGRVSGLNGQLFAEFEESLQSSARIQSGAGKALIYQKRLLLPPGVYKLELAVKDTVGQKLGSRSLRVEVSAPVKPGLLSSPVVAQSIEKAAGSALSQPFVLGLYKVVPDLRRVRGRNDYLDLFMQVFRPPLDQSTGASLLELDFEIQKDGRVVRRISDVSGDSIQFLDDSRAVIVKSLKTQGLEPGKYAVMIKARDQNGDLLSSATTQFEIAGR